MQEHLDAAIQSLRIELESAPVLDTSLRNRIESEIKLLEAVAQIIDNGNVEDALMLLVHKGFA